MDIPPRQASRGRPSERRRSRGRRAADESQAWLAAIVESSEDAVIGKTLDGTILSWNAGAERLYGYTAEEAVGRSLRMLAPPDRADEIPALCARLAAGERIQHLETTRLRKDGRLIDVSLSLSPVRDANGKIIGAAAIARDVTARLGNERHLAALHRKLEESEARFRRLRDSNLIGMFTATLDGLVVEANDAFLAAAGQTREALEKGLVRWDSLTAPEWKAADEKALEELRRTGTTRPYEKEFLRPDGERVAVMLAGAVLPDDDQQVIAYLVDLSARKKVEAELKRSNAELEAFAYVASHDLQEPLRKIMAFGELLERRSGPALDEGSRDFLKRMREASSRMSRLIQDLLQLSRVGRDTLPYQPVDLNKTVAADLIDLETVIKEAGATIEVGPLPTVKGNPFQLRQLFQNLLSNAVKFRRKDVPPSIKVVAREDAGGHVIIEVADNGIGFEEAYLERVFQPFQRLVTRQEFPGTGMGLALCRKIAERHGGSITARSTPGAGSVFVVSLPAATRPASETPPAPRP